MPKQALALALLCTAAITALGCAQPKPSFVGIWQADDLAGVDLPVPGESATLRVQEDQTLLFTLENADGRTLLGLPGTWRPVSDTRATLQREGDDNVGSLQLLDDNTLLGTSPRGAALEFTRVEEPPPTTQPAE